MFILTAQARTSGASHVASSEGILLPAPCLFLELVGGSCGVLEDVLKEVSFKISLYRD